MLIVLAFLERVPLALKLRGLTRKYLLRRAAADLLPRNIIERRKRGFSIPIAAWLNDDLGALTRDYLHEARLQREGIFNRRRLPDCLMNTRGALATTPRASGRF